jgi:hypothetical protein
MCPGVVEPPMTPTTTVRPDNVERGIVIGVSGPRFVQSVPLPPLIDATPLNRWEDAWTGIGEEIASVLECAVSRGVSNVKGFLELLKVEDFGTLGFINSMTIFRHRRRIIAPFGPIRRCPSHIGHDRLRSESDREH